MYYSILLRAGLLALILGSIQAQADERYPAADFQPKVIYQAQTEALGAGTATPDAKYPAASFTPQVVFQDPELIKTTGPLTQAAELAQAAPTRSAVAIPAKEARPSPKSTGAISDVTPPYGALGLAVAVVALAFWWSIRREKPVNVVAAGSNPTEETGDSEQQGLEAEEDLEELAVEIEETLATTNRQRAGKTKRTRRR
ncbi:MAG: hypothetical protein ACK4JF_01125 [Methylohalobius sp.]